jgi:hypothetical protein
MPPLPPTPELAAAIESLYKVFQAYPLRASTHPCPCCHNPEDERPLLNTSLRQLTEEDLRTYAMDAMLTWGDADDFRHFLPRTFELLASAERFTFADREIVLATLYHAEWRTWPEQEQTAVQEFLLAAWRLVVEVPPEDDLNDADELESWLCAIAQAEGDLSPYFKTWLESSTAIAAWNLATMITRAGFSFPHTRAKNAFWGGHRDQLEKISEWLGSAEVRKKLEGAMETFINEPCSEELFSALNFLS